MLFQTRRNLCIIQTETELKTISKEKLKQPLLEKPSNVIYFETGSGIYGLVSSGDIYRTPGAFIKINHSFISLTRNDFMQARKIFRENDKIHEIPVLSGRRLEGEFHQNDEVLMLDRIPSLERNGYTASYLSTIRKMALVRPAPSRPYKQIYFERMRSILDTYHIDYTVIDILDMVNDIDRFDKFLLIDFQEKAGALLSLYLNSARRIYYKALTYYKLLERLEADYEEIFNRYQQQGVDVILITAKKKNTEYIQKTESELRRRFPQEYPDNMNELVWPYADVFFDDMAGLPEYVDSILHGCFIVEQEDQFMHLRDMESCYINVRHGERVTVGQPKNYDRTIYFFGPCLIIGTYSGDALTIESWLQKMLNERGIPARVVNCGCWGGNIINISRILTTNFRPGDIMVAMMEDLNLPEERFRTLDLWEIMEQYQVPSEWMLDNPYHVNHHVNRIIAEALMNKMLNGGLFEDRPERTSALSVNKDLIDRFYIKKYFYGLRLDLFHTAACCVINGNPFTNGHRAMIEQAANETDHVYVLIVREDTSLFSFVERYCMAVEALKDMPNVTVVPSPFFMVNAVNFPAYFMKKELGSAKEQAENHVRAFAAVAERLHVTHRYLGEEPQDHITEMINQKSDEILPQFGIQTVIVPRVTFEGEYISGSRVRDLAEKADLSIRNLVPDTTADMIFCTSLNVLE